MGGSGSKKKKSAPPPNTNTNTTTTTTATTATTNSSTKPSPTTTDTAAGADTSPQQQPHPPAGRARAPFAALVGGGRSRAGSVRYGHEGGRTEAIPTFDLRGDKSVVTLPPVVLAQPFLREVKVPGNAIASLPDALSSLASLAVLDISHNALTAVDTVVALLTSLETLNLAGNPLKATSDSHDHDHDHDHDDNPWPDTLPASLHTLDASATRMAELPTCITNLAGLMNLKLRSNALVSLARPLAWTRLHTLDLAHNSLTKLDPQALASLQSLSSLNLSHNSLSQLPESLAQLPRLSTLDVAHNALTCLAPSLWSVTTLRVLNASFNEIVSWTRNAQHPAASSYSSASSSSSSSSDSLSNNDDEATTGSVPLPERSALQTVNLANNALTRVAWDALAVASSSLRSLDVSGNAQLGSELATASAAPLATCTRLGTLRMADCGLTAWPAWVSSLTGLETLAMSANPALPVDVPALGALTRLACLSLGWTTLAEPQLADYADTAPSSLVTLDVSCASGSAPLSGLFNSVAVDDAMVLDTGSVANLVPGANVTWAHAARTGIRPSMEDAFAATVVADTDAGHLARALASPLAVWAVFDGHINNVASTFAAAEWDAALKEELAVTAELADADAADADAVSRTVAQVLTRTLARVEDGLREAHATEPSAAGGTTAVAVALFTVEATASPRVVVVNVGDSKAARVAAAAEQAKLLSVDHTPYEPSEVERIRELGGFVDAEGRVQGQLGVARALGDFAFEPFVSSEPAVTVEPVDLAPGDTLVLACDGVWDVVSPPGLARLATHVAPAAAASVAAESAAANLAIGLRDAAFAMGSTDNISVVAICLTPTS